MSGPVIGILLAAGNSRRMGTNKLALPLGDTTIGSASLKSALSSTLDHVIIVQKKEDEAQWIHPAFFKKENWSQAACEDAFRGQAHSLAAGLKAAEEMGAQAAVILLADQPFAGSRLIDQVIDTYKEKGASFVASRFNGTPRPPVLFSSRLFPVLQGLQGDRGAGSLLKQPSFAHKGMMIDVEMARPFFDIDTKHDYEQVVRRGWDGCVNAGADVRLAAREFGRSLVVKERT
ncbi:NTP transferase domain-containing protein [Domibacillus tundrae]|uniref:NTP transferase domain-containing protein n=1 Tax=Domibacillus tundrae TaxID=1587527 RepID=UPI003396B970